jgi:hypothetical protein
MKGDAKMTINFYNPQILGRELQRDRMREAEQERLIKQVSGWNPSTTAKLFPIVGSYWKNFWSRVFRKGVYIPLSQLPKNSTSL